MSDEWDEQIDVLVVGSGFAGLAAAITAAEAGASVLVIEKMNSVGGNSKMSGGGVAAVGNPKQTAAGIDDSVELFTQDVLAAGGGTNDEQLVRVMGEQSWPAVRWTIDRLGVTYHDPLKQRGGHSVPRTYVATGGIGGYQIVKEAYDHLLELGVEVRKECKLETILLGPDGVEGVEVTQGYDFRNGDARGGHRRIRVTRGLVVAAGGFGNDTEFLSQQNDQFEDMDTTNHPGATGEVLRELLDVGARTVDLSAVQILPTTSPEEGAVGGSGLGNDFSIATVPHHIWVDPTTGQRFTNEASDRNSRAQAQLSLGNDPEYPILVMDSSQDDVYVDPAAAVDKGVVYKFETLEELADHFDIPDTALRAEVTRYNDFVEHGEDEDHGKLMTYANPLTDPPWYAMRVWPQVHYTMGGVAINSNGQVLDTEGKAIPGLYAAGEVTGGIHGQSRLTSNAITSCLVFGRIAGARVANGEFPVE